MYLLGVLCMFGFTVALPVLPEPPQLPYSVAAAHQMYTPNVNAASPSVRINNKEVKKDIIKLYTVSIPPPPELPPFDYSKFTNRKVQKARHDDSVESKVERSVEVKDLIPTEKTVEVVEKEFKPIENSKFQVEEQPMEASKSAEEPVPIEEFTYGEEDKSPQEPIPIKESTYIEKPISVEEPKPAMNLDTSIVETKEEPDKPSEDIPVVIQFTIPTTTFLSSIFSKFPSLSSFGFSWPFHLPSFFSRPRGIYPNYNIDDEIYPY